MSDDENLFRRTKRKSKSTKRRKHAERLSFADESESENDIGIISQQGNRSLSIRHPAKTNPGHRKISSRPFPVPSQNPRISKGEDNNGLDNDPRPDYSTQGLRLLRERTANKPKAYDARPLAVESEGFNANPRLGAYSGEPGAAQPKTENGADNFLSDIRNVGFIALTRDVTEAKLGDSFDVHAISTSDPMVVYADASNSDEGEWEKEQLRRVGLPIQDLKHDAVTDVRNARKVIEEEDMRLGARGETGPSVFETCMECVAEELAQIDSRVSVLSSKIDAIQKSIDKSASVQHEHDTAIAKSRARETFYATFSQFATDISEMLAELEPNINTFYSQRMAGLEKAALVAENTLTRTTDEFDRTLDISSTVLKLYKGTSHEKDVASPSSTHSEEHDDSEAVFVDVSEQFKSLKHIAGLFRDWRRRYPEDYVKAFGDMSIGKISGRIAMGRPNCEQLAWVLALPRNSRPYAIEASRVCELLEVWTIANWKPSSVESSKHLYKIFRDITENLAPEGKESQYAATAVTKLFDAFIKRLGFESSFLLHACNDSSTATELLQKSIIVVMTNSILVHSKSFESLAVLKIHNSRFLGLLFGDFMRCVALLSQRMQGTMERIELWSEVTEALSTSKSRVLRVDIPEWEFVRKEVQGLLELQPLEQLSSRVRLSFSRIGV